MWETVPPVAFLSVASATTEADECRGSFALHDVRARLVPDRHHVDKMEAFYRCDAGADLLRGAAFQEASDATGCPVLVITGLVSTRKAAGASRPCCCGLYAGGRPALSARYWILLEEKSDTQVAQPAAAADGARPENQQQEGEAAPEPRGGVGVAD